MDMAIIGKMILGQILGQKILGQKDDLRPECKSLSVIVS